MWLPPEVVCVGYWAVVWSVLSLPLLIFRDR